jgi:CO/xanthine dehydrogenase FAD-binding subunit
VRERASFAFAPVSAAVLIDIGGDGTTENASLVTLR